MHSILISTECVADLPAELIKEYGISIIYYDIQTEGGFLFRDTDEINSDNVMEYMLGGHKKAHSIVPTANDFKGYFSKYLEDYDEIVHICIGSGSSNAYENSTLARAKMGMDSKKVHIIDSKHLSSGQGLLVLEACKCRDKGMSGKEIAEYITNLVPRVSTSFLSYNADYLYYNGKVDKKVMTLCQTLNLHPVLHLVDGKITLKKVYIGNYDRAASKYIKSTIGDASTIDNSIGFITYAGCTEEALNTVKDKISKFLTFDKLYEQKASATVSCNCGPKTFGVLFIRKE